LRRWDGEEIVGLVTYRVKDGVFEITSLDSLREDLGIGTAMLEKVIAIAKARPCLKIIVTTTNDNIHAIRFYQKRGFDLVRLHHDSIKQARVLKPEIPMIGQNGIPIEHELEFEFLLENDINKVENPSHQVQRGYTKRAFFDCICYTCKVVLYK